MPLEVLASCETRGAICARESPFFDLTLFLLVLAVCIRLLNVSLRSQGEGWHLDTAVVAAESTEAEPLEKPHSTGERSAIPSR